MEAIKIKGYLNIDALEQALTTIIERHESLRTQFIVNNEVPIQVITQEWVFKMPLINLSNLSNQEQSVALQSILQEESKHTFKLTLDLMLRASLIKLNESEHILLIVIHHTTFDGWSMGVFYSELSTLYQDFNNGKSSSLPPLAIQYADFAQWQRNWLQGAVLESQLSYWQEQLGGILPVLQLATDYPRPPIQTYNGASVSVEISPVLTTQLNALSQQEGVTLFMTLLAAFQILLYRYSGQEDIIVGTAIANRNRQEIESLIGFFVNTLALRINFSNHPSFQELLVKVKEICLDAYSHQDIPFEKLVEELQPERNFSHNPIFQVMFVLQNTPQETIKIPNLTIEQINLKSQTTKVDLTLSLTETTNGLIGTWKYNTDLFADATINRMSGHFQQLLTEIVANLQIPVTKLSILTARERHQLLIEWNQTQTNYQNDKCIHQLFEEQAERTPNQVAVVFEEQELTYLELNQRANQLAHYLQKLGVKPDVLVGICVERSLEMIIGLLGILKAGGAYVPLDPNYPQERLAFMLDDSQISILLTQTSLIEKLPSNKAHVIFLNTDWKKINCESKKNLNSEAKPNNLAYLIYTSGSTGKPKGILLNHKPLVNLLEWQLQNSSIGLGGKTLQFTPISFDVSFQEIFSTCLAGGTLILISDETRKDAVALLQFLHDQEIERLFLPFIALQNLAEIAKSQEQSCPSLREIITAGEQLQITPSIANWFTQHPKCILHNHYGPSESHVVTAYTLIGNPQTWKTLPPIGHAIQNVQIFILDIHLQPLPIGVIGELFIGVDDPIRGYINRPDLTSTRFISNPFSSDPNARLYKTGDLARYLADGNIEYIGRIDHQVKIRGFRIELGEIEAILNQHPDISNAVAIVREDNPGDKRIIAYITSENQAKLTQSELRQFVKQKLPDYMIPSVFVTLEIFPITPNGKVDRRALPKPELLRETKFIPPSSLTEEIIILIWSNILRISAISREDNFFEIGGHSILATQVISRLQEAFKQEIPIKTLLKYPTPAELAKVIEQKYYPEKNLTIIETLKKRENLPLSFAQLRMWFLYQLEGKSATYNVAFALQLEGKLNQSSLEKAFQKIIERHEILRTSFIAIDGSPVQVITPALNFALSVVDLEAQKQIEELVKTEVNLPFDLTVSPLFRAKILRLTKTSHILLITFHHIIIDGWSMGVFHSELSTLYQDFNNGKSSSLPPLAIQYADFAQWQRNWLQGAVLESQLSYWQEQLGGILPVLQLATDYPRPPIQTYSGASVSVEISPVLTNQLKALSQQEGVTLFMTLLAAFQILLYRYTGQEDIIVGTAIANRNRQEIESLIGFFVNTLALRINFSNHPSFQELLIKVKEICLDAYSHQDIPFEKLVEELQPERNFSHNPIFQVMFVLQNTPQETIKIPDLTIESINLNNQTSKFDLTLSLTETTNGLIGTWEYNTDLFADATINRISGHFQQLLTGIVANPEISITNLSILTTRERHQLLIEWNQTQANYPNDKCIHQLFEEQVERTPNQVAVVFEEQELTYLELNQRANQLAHYLQKLGVKPEVLVGICVERSLEMIIGLLGILKAGGAYVPLDPNYPQERLAFMLDDSQISILLTQTSLIEKLPSNKAHILCLKSNTQIISCESNDNPICHGNADNLAYITYTSGSTGQPKGVCIIHQGVVRLVKNNNYANLNSEQTFLQLAPISFDASTFEIWGSLLNGAKLVIFSAYTPSLIELGQAIRRYQITTLWLTAGLFHLMVDERVDDLKSLHQLLAGGDVLSISHVQKLHQIAENCQIINGYGPTENTTFTCCYPIPELAQLDNSVPIGRPINNTQVYILDQHLNPVPIAVPGELYISGDGLARGYLNQPELTKEKFITNPFREGKLYKTGDLARYLPDGNIEYIGRIDHQVKIRGFRIELGEIEAILNQHPDISNAVAIVREDNPGDKRIIAYITSENQAKLTQSELRQFVKPKLPEYMIPSVFVTLETLPLTPNGKVDRRALPIPEQIRHETEETFVTPRNELEQQLTKIWEVILGIQPISIKDNFFDLGGHSLLAVRLLAQIEKTFSINLPLAAIFQSPTIEELANILDSQGWSSPWYSLVPLQPKGSRPLLFGIHHFYSQDLIRHLGEEQPIYSLHYGMAAPVNQPLTLPKMEDLAAHYIQEMRSLQPQGPYFLMGSSFGGVLAYEMAQQLFAQGQQVSLLALFDSSIQKSNLKLLSFSHWLTLLWNLGFSEFWKKAKFRMKSKFSQLISRYLSPMNRTNPFDSQYFPHIFNEDLIKATWNDYTPKSYSGRVVLFKAINIVDVSTSIIYSVEPPEVVWRKFVNGELVVHEVPGNHTTILEDPNVQIIAETLTQYIDEAKVSS
ncbi:MAG: amino acid adenylation domain-containing protein [Dolichospermum sp. DET50]|nr:amino acid adenylation domain-containing protein [Dolichospermum sp. DET66]MBS3031774.1 amino acid adenylation domain-containing protein [Dolichospermum sp. DET67]MBS3036985.1 amino acid adenylation domain-containing protein [Dolichospermum sp. DET50]QSX68997.1 MAG: amino acid adenylation domain-containing protein [Dolichospermum sp. DET69]